MRYFRSWLFDAGVVLLTVGVFATHHGVRAFRAAESRSELKDQETPQGVERFRGVSRHDRAHALDRRRLWRRVVRHEQKDT